MVTTRRSSNQVTNAFEQFAATSGSVAMLERPMPVEEPVVKAPVAAAKPAQVGLTDKQLIEAENRRKNLDRILNYDRYSEQMSATAVVEEPVAKTVVEEKPAKVEVALSDEDIKPTSTTMQFGEDIEGIREEMKMERNSSETERISLNGKGKLAIVLYSLVVSVILALIVINTGMLAKLSDINKAKANELNASIEQYAAIVSEIDSISDSNYIAGVAENELGMIKGN